MSKISLAVYFWVEGGESMGLASRFDVCLRLVVERREGDRNAGCVNDGCGLVGGGGWRVIFGCHGFVWIGLGGGEGLVFFIGRGGNGRMGGHWL